MKHRSRFGAVLFCFSLALIPQSIEARVHHPDDQAPDRLEEAKGLYESAEYDRALATLEGIDTTRITREQARDRILYQALCLLALENSAEAGSKINELVQGDPLFRPGSETPPRLRALVEEVRGRLRPALAQQHYRKGKELFDAGNYAAALPEFSLVIQLADTAGGAGAPSELADMKMLASGFRDLAERSVLTKPTTPVPALPPAREPDAPVEPPVVIRQDMPAWPSSLSSNTGVFSGGKITGVLEIVVAPDGRVTSAKVVKPIHPLYDGLLVLAAKQWKYEPATRNGQPVEFVKVLTVNVNIK